jgi:hypothetical protein
VNDASLAGAELEDDALRAAIVDSVQEAVGHLGKGLVPANALPAAATTLAGALEGIEQLPEPYMTSLKQPPFWQPRGFMSGTPSSICGYWAACSSRQTTPSLL